LTTVDSSYKVVVEDSGTPDDVMCIAILSWLNRELI